MVTVSVNSDTMTAAWCVGAVASPVRPAMPAAVGSNSRPMTATMAPMAAGGKTTSIQSVPAKRTTCETTMKKRPKAMNPLCAAA